eukprot:scpid28298/ scgid14568/ 
MPARKQFSFLGAQNWKCPDISSKKMVAVEWSHDHLKYDHVPESTEPMAEKSNKSQCPAITIPDEGPAQGSFVSQQMMRSAATLHEMSQPNTYAQFSVRCFIVTQSTVPSAKALSAR